MPLFPLRIPCFGLLVALLVAGPADAQRRIHRVHSTEDGLAQSQVNAVLEDGEGFLWLGTFGGLSRFDGRSFRNFDTGDGLPGLDVRVIEQLADDTLVFGTYDGGLALRHRGDEGFVVIGPEDGLPDPSVRDILEREDGSVWVATGNGIAVYSCPDSLDRPPARHLLAGESIGCLEAAPGGGVYAGTFGSGLYSISEDGVRREEVPGDRIRDVLAAPPDGGGPVLSVVGDGAWRRRGNEWVRLEVPGLGDADVKTFRRVTWEDGTESLVLGTTGSGAFLLTDGVWEHLDESAGLPSGTVWGVAPGEDGVLYLATWGGLAVHDRDRVLTLDESTGLPNATILSLAELPDGTLALGTAGEGVVLWRDGRLAGRITPADGLASGVVWSLHATADGDLFVGTHRGVYRYRAGSLRAVHGEGDLLTGRSYRIRERSDGALLFATYDGMFVHRDGVSTLLYEEPEPRRAIYYDVLETADGTLHLATREGAVTVRDGRASYPEADDPLATTHLWCITELDDGTLVYGTNGAGAILVRNGQRTRLTRREGLRDDTVYAVLEHEGRLYLSTHRGVNVVERAGDGFEVRVIDHRDGLAGLEGCQGAALRAHDGRLWFGTVRGASGIDPDLDRPDHTPPRIVLDGMGLYDGPLRPPAVFAGRRFPHDRNYFRFSFVGIQFRAPEKVRYRYRMSSIDRDWVESDLGRVQYTALPPGNYEFAVTAGNEWGVWSEPGTVRFSIAPPFWRTWWFLLLVVLLAGGTLAAVVSFRVRQLLALERLRTRIAADLHDDIGSGLTEIAMLGEVVRSRLGDEAAPAELGTMTRTARRLTASMSDIVWLVNPRTDSLPDLVRRLVDTYRPLFQGTGVEFRVEGLDSVPDLRLAMETRQNLLLAAKEMLHNALRHAGAGTVVLRVGNTREGRELSVEDDGRGFDPDGASTGNGLANLERRARAVGGRLEITSAPGRGSRLRILW